jgi:hypothetical protein
MNESINEITIDQQLEKKIEQFHDYFTIEQDININVTPLPSDEIIPDHESFVRNMPYSFRLASEVSSLEASALRPLRNHELYPNHGR